MTNLLSNQTFTGVSNNLNFDTSIGDELSLFDNLTIEEGTLFVNNGIQTSSAATYEFLSMNADGSEAASTPTTIDMGSSSIGNFVTINIQSQVNNIGQTAAGMLKTSATEASIAFKEAEAGEGTGANIIFNADGVTVTGLLNSLPVALSSYTAIETVPFAVNGVGAGGVDLIINKINKSDYIGTVDVAIANLPPAVAGAIVIYTQALEYTGVNPLFFTCIGTDVFAEGSKAPNNAGAWVSSAAGDQQIKFIPAASNSNYFDANSIIEFQCANVEHGEGTWFVNIKPVAGATSDGGVFSFP